MDINDELNKLNNKQRQELEKWFAEQIYKLNKVNKNEQRNYVLYVTRKQVVWVDFEGFSYCKIDQLRAISKLRIQTKKFVNKYYNNFNRKTGKYSNPEVSTEQMNLIDTAIQELKYRSK